MAHSTDKHDGLGSLRYSDFDDQAVFSQVVVAAFAACVACVVGWAAEREVSLPLRIIVLCACVCIIGTSLYRLSMSAAFRVHENGLRAVGFLQRGEMAFSSVKRIHPVAFTGGISSRFGPRGWQLTRIRFTSDDGSSVLWRWGVYDNAANSPSGNDLSILSQVNSPRMAMLLDVYSAVARNVEEHIAENGFYQWGDSKRITAGGVEYRDGGGWKEIPAGDAGGAFAWCVSQGRLRFGETASGEALYDEAVDYGSLFPGLLVLMRREKKSEFDIKAHILTGMHFQKMNVLADTLVYFVGFPELLVE